MELSVEDVKKYQLDILKVVDAFCKEKGIRYFMGYGTLLGAVRHQGYIPWDDDIDIVMLRKDYDRFIKEFNDNRSDEYEVLHCSVDKNYPYGFAKVHNKQTILKEVIALNYEIGVNIDVFVLDDIGDNKDTAFSLAKKIAIFHKFLSWKYLLPNKLKSRPLFKAVGVIVLRTLSHLKSIYSCTSNIDKVAKSFICSDSKYVANICENWFGAYEILEKSWLDESVELEFEGQKFIGPKEYDKILTTWYGDYMQPPTVDKQVTHHSFIAYTKE